MIAITPPRRGTKTTSGRPVRVASLSNLQKLFGNSEGETMDGFEKVTRRTAKRQLRWRRDKRGDEVWCWEKIFSRRGAPGRFGWDFLGL